MLFVQQPHYLPMGLTMAHKRSEEEIIVRYLVGKQATPRVVASYRYALQNIAVDFSNEQQRLWNLCMKRPWLIPHVDAWLGFRQPDHPVRKKIFIMLGVLETQPDYSEFFLPSRHSFIYLLNICVASIWAIIKIGTGRMITWMI